MKIVFANNYFYLRGGSERILFEEMELFKNYGHEVVPFSRHHKENHDSEYSKYFAPDIEYENVVIIKKVSSSIKLVYSLDTRNNLSALLSYFKPDIIHAHNIYGRLTTSVIDAARNQGIPVVMTLNDYKLICPSYLMLSKGKVCDLCKSNKFYFCTFKRCHRNTLIPSLIYTIESYFNSFLKKYDYVRYLICPSRFLLDKHMEAGVPVKKLVHIPHFLNLKDDMSSFTVGEYILYAGRLSREKGVLTLIKAMKELDLHLKIAGGGPMESEYRKYVKDKKINNVSFEGFKSGDKLRDLYIHAAFIVVPSEWYENLPMTIMESFAAGKPVLAANIGGIPEMVIHGATGFLFRPGDHQELRKKIQYLITNPSLIIKMGKNARKKVKKEYNPENHYEQLMAVYERALS